MARDAFRRRRSAPCLGTTVLDTRHTRVQGHSGCRKQPAGMEMPPKSTWSGMAQAGPTAWPGMITALAAGRGERGGWGSVNRPCVGTGDAPRPLGRRQPPGVPAPPFPKRRPPSKPCAAARAPGPTGGRRVSRRRARLLTEHGGAPGVGQVLGQRGQGVLAGGLRRHGEADERQHGEAAVLDLLHLELVQVAGLERKWTRARAGGAGQLGAHSNGASQVCCVLWCR